MSMDRDIQMTMKAVVVRKTGPASSAQALHFETHYPRPTLVAGHAMVKNSYAGINFIDTYHRQGLYPRNVPFICGQEGGGTIVSIMKGDDEDIRGKDFNIGDRVVYSCLETYSEYTLVPITKLIHVPKEIDMKKAIACMVQGLTAHYLVNSSHANLIQQGEFCLIYSVGSGTCQWAAQMAKINGYRVIGVCSKGKVEQARNTGCDHLIILETEEGCENGDYNSVDIVQKVTEITQGEGVKLILDGVGKSTAEISLQCLAKRGIFVSFGNASGKVEPFPLLRLAAKSAFVTRPKLLDYISSRSELLSRMDDIFKWVKDGKLEVSIDKEFLLENASEAHHFIEAGKTKGKLLLKIM